MASLDDTNDPSGHLIAANQVQGTAVYGLDGAKVGSLYDVMIDKRSGRIAYAVLSFGGFLGIGDRYHPLPWEKLRYDTDRGGYVVDIDREMLEGAPSYSDGTNFWGQEASGQGVYGYYGVQPFWDLTR